MGNYKLKLKAKLWYIMRQWFRYCHEHGVGKKETTQRGNVPYKEEGVQENKGKKEIK